MPNEPLYIAADDEISECIKQYADMIYRIAFSYLKSMQSAEDAVQDTFIRYMQNCGKLESEEHKKAWLIRACINICKDELKSFRHKETVELTDTIPFESEYEKDVVTAVLALPPKYRAVIYLYFFEGYNSAEIARILKMKDATIRSRLSRAKRMLKTELEGEYSNEIGI